jgi:hypothetical protein
VKNECGTCGTLPAEICDGMDNNCNGFIDEGAKNACGACGPVPAEVCDGRDNNCDGKVDEGVSSPCGGCQPTLFTELQATGLGQICAYYWDNSTTGDCTTAGITRCRTPDSVFCDAPKPACAPR